MDKEKKKAQDKASDIALRISTDIYQLLSHVDNNGEFFNAGEAEVKLSITTDVELKGHAAYFYRLAKQWENE